MTRVHRGVVVVRIFWITAAILAFLLTIWIARSFAPESNRASFLIALVGLAMVTLSVVAATYLGRHEHIHTGASIVQAFLTSTAIGLAGYFYFVEGRGKPHADVSQTIQTAPLRNGDIVVEAAVVVKNLGTQRLRVSHITSVLQIVDLKPLGMENVPDSSAPYWNALDEVGGLRGPAFKEGELRWPQARRFDGSINHEIEAGESDLITVTFLVPCFDIRYARVATDVTKGGEDQMVWKARSFVDLDSVCSGGK